MNKIDESWMVGWVVDPPSGWKYGFPRVFNPNPGEDLAQWFVRVGYPARDLELALKYSRFWQAEAK